MLPSRHPVRSPTDQIPAPQFPRGLPWVNVAPLRMDKQRGRPVLVEFWDFCRVNSLRTLPYVQRWHERYEPHGLRVIGVHAGGFAFSRDEDAVRAAVERLGITYPVVVDAELEIWDAYGTQGWPARFLWNQRGALFSFHYGEGAYEETEREIQELLGLDLEPLAPLRPEDAPGVLLAPPTEHQPGAYSGPYEAGGVWAVLEGAGELRVNGAPMAVQGPACVPLVEHGRHTRAELRLEPGPGVVVHETCFTPGVD
jgi:thiol-disulfide isomerase/thioredoxin